MTYLFCPPARESIARYEAKDREARNHRHRLFRHIEAGMRAVNVWKLPNGTYVESFPRDTATYSSFPATAPATFTIEYLGGRCHEVTAAEAAALTAAGYTVEGWSVGPSSYGGYGGQGYAAGRYGG